MGHPFKIGQTWKWSNCSGEFTIIDISLNSIRFTMNKTTVYESKSKIWEENIDTWIHHLSRQEPSKWICIDDPSFTIEEITKRFNRIDNIDV